MARYSRINGPTADFAIPAAITLIPGLTITRTFGAASLLILAHATYLHAGAVAGFATLIGRLDGTNLAPQGRTGVMQAGEQESAVMITHVQVAEGTHTIELLAQRVTADAISIPTRSAILSVIELPDWDDEANLITL